MALMRPARKTHVLAVGTALLVLLAGPLSVRAQLSGSNTTAPFNYPYVVCDRLTNTLFFQASAGVEQGYSEQWVAYTFSVYQDGVGWVDVGNGTRYTDWDWIKAKNTYTTGWIPGVGPGGSYGSVVNSVPNPVTDGPQWNFPLAETPSSQGYAVQVNFYWWDSGNTGWAWSNQVWYNGYGWSQSSWCSL